MLRALLKRNCAAEPRPSAVLPPDVLAALEGAYVVERSPSDEGEPRVILMPAGCRGGWVHGEDRAAISALWPELSSDQLERAVRMAASVVARRIRTEVTRRAKGWVHDY